MTLLATKRQWLFTSSDGERRAALLEDDHVVELYYESALRPPYKGCVFSGEVQDVISSMHAVFVAVTQGIHTFTVFLQVRPQEPLPCAHTRVIVQINSEARGTKAPEATEEITLPGYYVVLTPRSSHVGSSKKLSMSDERAQAKVRLGRALESCGASAEGVGAIARTSIRDASDVQLEAECASLLECWHGIEKRAARAGKPEILWQEENLFSRLVRDRLMTVSASILAEGESYTELCEALSSQPNARSLFDATELYADPLPLFETFGVDEVARALRERSVELFGGGELIIDCTEALVAIDVNTAHYTGGKNFAETALVLNETAAREAARQIRLRNLSGIIVVDFINMNDEKSRQQVDEIFATELAKDPARIRVLPIDELGLAKLTRRRQ